MRQLPRKECTLALVRLLVAKMRAPQRDMVCDRSCLCCSRNRGNPGYGLWLVTEKLVTFEVLPRSTNLSRLTTHRHPISRTLRRASHR